LGPAPAEALKRKSHHKLLLLSKMKSASGPVLKNLNVCFGSGAACRDTSRIFVLAACYADSTGCIRPRADITLWIAQTSPTQI
jgi:hypothetical protein